MRSMRLGLGARPRSYEVDPSEKVPERLALDEPQRRGRLPDLAGRTALVGSAQRDADHSRPADLVGAHHRQSEHRAQLVVDVRLPHLSGVCGSQAQEGGVSKLDRSGERR